MPQPEPPLPRLRSPLARARYSIGRAWGHLPYALQPPNLRRRENWAIGMYGGPDPLHLSPLPGVRNPILDRYSVPGVDVTFVADPFLFRWEGRWYLFFELFNDDAEKGEIGVASSDDARRWRFEAIVISEPYHLSYPFPIEVDGVPHLVVESFAAGVVRAYRPTDFPRRWEPAADLLSDMPRVDPTIVEHDGRWWLFTGVYADGWWRRLDLHSAPAPLGPYTPHPSSPVIVDDSMIARPAGRIVRTGDRLIRFGQDCTNDYGERVWAIEIETLTPETYRERPLLDRPVLAPNGRGWTRRHMHHVDAHQVDDGSWIAAVDGW